MNDSEQSLPGPWAAKSENFNDNIRSSPTKAEVELPKEALVTGDLRRKLRSRNGQLGTSERPSHGDGGYRDDLSPLRSSDHQPCESKNNHRWQEDDLTPHRRRQNTNDQNSSAHHGPNYQREKDGLSPLRSPLVSDQCSNSQQRNGKGIGRRRSIRQEKMNREVVDGRNSQSPTKKNKMTDSTTSPSKEMNCLSVDSDDGTPIVSKSILYEDRNSSPRHRFRRRLNLPSERDSDEERGTEELNPENDDDKATLARREKQIMYGKETESYKLYLAAVPKEDRGEDRKMHPRTPLKIRKCSRRNWDAQIKAWKKYLHVWARLNSATPLESSQQAGSDASSVQEDSSNQDGNEEDDELDLNEVDDVDFLDGFELQYDTNPFMNVKSS